MGLWNPYQSIGGSLAMEVLPEESKKRMHYDDLLADMDGWLKEFWDLEEILQSTKEKYNTLEINPDSGEGWLKEFFYRKEEINRNDVEGLVKDMIAAVEELREQREWLKDQRDYWAEKEEEALKKLEEEWNEYHNE